MELLITSRYSNRFHASLHTTLTYYLCIVFCCLMCSALPTKVQSQQSASAHRSALQSDSALLSIVHDLEDAVFRLKEYALKMDLESSRTDEGDEDTPTAEISELDSRQSDMNDQYPEFVPELMQRQDKKSAESPPSAASKTTASSPPTAAAAAGGKEDDISLREALEFLVSLAKQKKQQRRDHDIPFP